MNQTNDVLFGTINPATKLLLWFVTKSILFERRRCHPWFQIFLLKFVPISQRLVLETIAIIYLLSPGFLGIFRNDIITMPTNAAMPAMIKAVEKALV